jgi:alanyl-tRNA synthetase
LPWRECFALLEDTMDSRTLRELYIGYFEQHGHARIPGAPLVPEHDPSVLFTTAGMHPLVPFLLGTPHPAGRRLVDAQPCLRTNDIEEVGDDRHLTFFEMLGNWSLGDYWKDESIRMSYAFLTERLGLDPARLSVTCFAGDADAPRDDESAGIWRALGIPEERITFLAKEDNWWGPAGATGPCGPDTEIFYDLDPSGPRGETPASNPARFREIWNNVFMQYEKLPDGSYTRLAQRNVDTGFGLERVLPIMQGVASVYETDLFAPIMATIRELAAREEPLAERIVADHARAATMLLAEGVRPGRTDQPYIVRRLIRRAIRYGRELGIEGPFLSKVAAAFISTLADAYPLLERRREEALALLEEEELRFRRTLARGEREFERVAEAALRAGRPALAGEEIFRLYETYGFPAELTAELAAVRGLRSDLAGFDAAFARHQEESGRGAEGRFRGGLAERAPETTRLHTATHLLHAALRQTLGPHVAQRGSNITAERLRFDFSHGERLTAEQLAAAEELVNAQIRRDLPVTCEEMSLAEARERGALGLFEERYGERVRVYQIGDFSVEVCGGPHVERTGELGRFRIQKEEAVAAGVRRIRATVEAPERPEEAPESHDKAS